ncbi:putative Sugar transporter [Plasmodium knowlesi]|uniref:Putative Sugar transporter n=1 Tax=Plasmodium knowlesi TaxID=5850 RepID=A0A1Y3DUW0_PLAKN|nr:putative Sugar transporter [Plasmodium knowlesi]
MKAAIDVEESLQCCTRVSSSAVGEEWDAQIELHTEAIRTKKQLEERIGRTNWKNELEEQIGRTNWKNELEERIGRTKWKEDS